MLYFDSNDTSIKYFSDNQTENSHVFDCYLNVYRDAWNQFGKVQVDCFLFGSFYYLVYGGETLPGDIDIAVQYNPFNEEKLLNLGWQLVRNSVTDQYYLDSMTVKTYEKSYKTSYFFGKEIKPLEVRVQISLKKNLYTFQKVWNSLPISFMRKHFCKSSNSYLGKESLATLLDSMFRVAKSPKNAFEKAQNDQYRFLQTFEDQSSPVINGVGLVGDVLHRLDVVDRIVHNLQEAAPF